MKYAKYLIFIMLSWMIACSGDEAADVTPITITANDFNSSIDENPEEGAVIGVLSASATEGTISYELVSSNPSNAIAINPSKGEITVVDPILFDYEVRSTVTAQVRVAVASVSETVTITITIQDLVEAPRNGLLAEYLFNGNANDTGGNGYDPETVTATLTSDRKNTSNSAYQFDGTQSISIPDFVDLSPNTISISLWFKTTSTNNGQRFVFVGSLAENRQNYSLNANFDIGKADFRYEPSIPFGGTFATSTTIINDGEWHHLVGVRDHTAKLLTLYVDGEVEDTKTYVNDPVPSDSPLYFGTAFRNIQTYVGDLDDVRIYNRALTASDVLLLYNED